MSRDQRRRLREVDAVLRQIESQDKNEKKAPTVDASLWLQNWKRRKEKEESDKLEEQRKQEALSPAERLAEVDAVLATLEEKAKS
jgi:hypothetical protein